jgi:excisionase family DNA binding protein
MITSQHVTLTAASHILGVSLPTLRRMVDLKQITYQKVGKRIRFTREGLQEFLETSTVERKGM